MVFAGVDNPPTGSWPKKPYTAIVDAPIAREKPFLLINESGKFAVNVPAFRSEPSRGTTWQPEKRGLSPLLSRVVSIDDFYVAHPETDTDATINAALASGKNLLFTPGIYRVAHSIRRYAGRHGGDGDRVCDFNSDIG